MMQLTDEEITIVTAAGDEVMRKLRAVCERTPAELELHIILTVARSAVATMIWNGVDPLVVFRAIASCVALVKAGEMPLLRSEH